jgi:hypothetical protein
MSTYTYDTFLNQYNDTDSNLQIVDTDGVIKFTINPYSILTTMISNNLLTFKIKSGRLISIPFSTMNESKIALISAEERIQLLINKTPNFIDKQIENFIYTSGGSGATGSTGSTGPTGPSGTGVSIITVSKSELDTLILSDMLVVGATYKITGVDPELYNDGSYSGTTIYLQAFTANKLSEKGYGEFWNPIYDHQIDGFNVWNNFVYFNGGTPTGKFNSDEYVTSDTGATGILVPSYESGAILPDSGQDWTGSTFITGISSGATGSISITSNPTARYSVGDSVIWGGYSWLNVTGNCGVYNDKYQLNSDWEKQPYTEMIYNKVFDYIEYDYEADAIITRHDVVNKNYVSCSRANVYWNFNERHPINLFQWGNFWDVENTGSGVGDNYVEDSIFECLNFRGYSIYNNRIINNSQIVRNQFYGDVEFFNNILTYSYIKDNIFSDSYIFENNMDRSTINYNKLTYSNLSYNKLTIYSSIYDNKIVNASIEGNILDSNSVIGSNEISSTYIDSNNLFKSDIVSNKGNVYMDSNILSNSEIAYNIVALGSIQKNILSLDGYINYNTITLNGQINENIISSSQINSNTVSSGGYSKISRNILSGLSAINGNNLTGNGYVTIMHNSINLSQIMYNSLYIADEFGACEIRHNVLPNSGSINDNILNRSTFTSCRLEYGTIQTSKMLSSGISNCNISNNSEINLGTATELTNKYINNLVMDNGKINIDIATAVILFENYPKTVYKRPDGLFKIRYYNNDDNLVIADISD